MSNGVKFIRVNGRVVPIKDKGPTKKQIEKNYKKHGDGARQASAIDEKYNKKASKGVNGLAGAGVASAAAGYFVGGKKGMVLGALGAAALLLANRKKRKNEKNLNYLKEKEYVRKLGMTSEGQRPSKNKSSV